jgi:cytochrome P450
MAHDDAQLGKPSARPAAAGCPLADINFFDPGLLQDPYPAYERLRNEAPVYRDPHTGIVFVSTYDLVLEVNRQPAVFSSDFGAQLQSGAAGALDPEELAILSQGFGPVSTMLTADPPVHTRFRKLGAKAFTFKRVEQMGAYIAEVAERLIDGFVAAGHCEFKTQFADALPMTVIADALGVPRADMGQFKIWSDSFIAQLSGMADRERRLEAARHAIAFQRYFVDMIEQKRANPTDDIISDLVHADLAEEGDPRKMTDAELVSIFQQLLVAGNETTAHSITAGFHHLLTRPGLADALRADPELVPGFVEETLRHLAPVSNMWRLAKRDTEIGGVPIRAGEMILVRYGSANRDVAHFTDPDTFDPRRENAREHLSFGAGIHTCIGASLARKEMAIAFPIVLRRLKNPRLRDRGETLRYSPNIILRGVLELNVAFDTQACSTS